VAATREGALHGVPGVAFSHYKKKTLEYDWSRITQYTQRVLAEVLQRPTHSGEFWNVNYPHLMPGEPEPMIIDCETDRHPLPLTFVPHDDGWKYAGDYHQRRREEQSDVAICFGGQVALAKLHI
jgi:5'-nucleotidase